MIPPNPVLPQLGFASDERLLIVHADDIGSFQGTVAAYEELLTSGLVTSAATMVPCGWFPATAELCRTQHTNPRLDLGVHLTLTSEWDGCRWGPISAAAPADGLHDDEGYFPRSSPALQQTAEPAAVQTEVQAQLDRALRSGIDVTHIDTHMFTLFHPRFVDLYVDLALTYRLPAFLLRRSVPEFHSYSFSPEAEAALLVNAPLWEERGLPLFDAATMMPLDNPGDRTGQLRQKLRDLQPGLNLLLLHPTVETAELPAAVPAADWPCRVADYQTFKVEELRAEAASAGIHLLGYRTLRDLMRGD